MRRPLTVLGRNATGGKKYSSWVTQLPDNIYCGALVGEWQVRGNRGSSFTCPPQVLRGLPWDLTTVSAVRCRRPTGLNHGAAHTTFAVSFGLLVWKADEVIKRKLRYWLIYLQRICASYAKVRTEVRWFRQNKVHFASNYIWVYTCVKFNTDISHSTRTCFF